jgi:hypothetical protein
MHLCITYLLLLILYVPYASSTPSPPAPAKPIKPYGCHKGSDFTNVFIFFQTSADPYFDFGIKTHHREYYPKALESALRLDDFQVRYLSTADKCGWHKTKSVTAPPAAIGGTRGTIYWKYSDLHWVQDEKNKTASHWVFSSPDHKPLNKSATPSTYTLDRITRILDDNEPAADVYQLSTIILGYACGFLCFALLMVLIQQAVLHGSRPKGNEDPDAIELLDVAIDSTAKLSTTPQTPAAVAVPDNVRISTQDHTGSAQSDPPPRYSYASSRREGASSLARE